MVEIKNRKLNRLKDNRIFLGLCSGLGEYYGISTSLLRLFFIFLGLTQGIGVVFYLGIALFIPEESGPKTPPEKKERKENIKKFIQELQTQEKKSPNNSQKWHSTPKNIQGLIIIGIGLVLLFNQFFNFWLQWKIIWPSILMLAGVYLILGNDEK